MASTAFMTAYQGSKDMHKYEGSKADMKKDRASKKPERSSGERMNDKKEATAREASKTIVGRAKASRMGR
jgi:hypothetical protein